MCIAKGMIEKEHICQFITKNNNGGKNWEQYGEEKVAGVCGKVLSSGVIRVVKVR